MQAVAASSEPALEMVPFPPIPIRAFKGSGVSASLAALLGTGADFNASSRFVRSNQVLVSVKPHETAWILKLGHDCSFPITLSASRHC